MQTIVVVPPAETVVTVAEAKRHARIALDLVDDDLDAQVAAYIDAATRTLETITSRALVTQTLETTFDGPIAHEWHSPTECYIRSSDQDHAFRLPRAPVASVVEVGYVDGSGDAQILDDGLYRIGVGTPGHVVRPFLSRWPSGSTLRVRYVAGEAPEAVDPRAKLFVCMMVANWYDRREPIAAGVAELPWSARTLADSLRWGWYVR